MTKEKKYVKVNAKRLQGFRSASEVFIADLADSPKDCEKYLEMALMDYEDNKDLSAFLLALRNIAIARGGIGQLAAKTNLHRQTIYKALSPKGNPSFLMIDLILNALGMKFSVMLR